MLSLSRPYTLSYVRFLSVGRRCASLGAVLLGLALAPGCGKQKQSTVTPGSSYPPPRTVMAEPSARQDVYVEQAVRYDAPPAAYPEALGYEELSNGEQVVVVEYVHTYPEEIETFPQVAWAGRTYYNVHGDFVYWSDGWGWCYYLGPPGPLVTYWNGYYPWAPYAWGVGYYGPGWYWGGVGMYGYHAYGLSVVHHNHHHHGYHQNSRRPGRDPRPSRTAGATVPNAGRPTGPVHKGEPVDRSRRTNPSGGKAEGATRTTPGRYKGNAPTRRNPAPTNALASRTNPTAAVRTNGYTTAGGQRITVVDPRATRTSPAVRRNPSKTTRPSTVGRVPAFSAPTRAQPSGAGPTRTSAPAPVRTNTRATTSPRRTQPTPSWGSSYANGPQRTAPARSAPSGSPARSNASRSTPTRSAPTRSAPTRSAPRRSSPVRSSPTRSAPRRSAPTRSAPVRSSPSRSAPTRSSPSRSAPRRSSGKR